MFRVKRSFFLLLFFLLILFILPKKSVDFLRSKTVDLFSSSRKEKIQDRNIELENLGLKKQLERLVSWVFADREIEKQWQDFQRLSETDDSFFERRKYYLAQILDQQLRSIPAKVIFRELATWSSSVWIDVGERDNQVLGQQVIAENSPIVVGKCVVGVVEKVEKTKAKVRLLTDPALSIAVRVVRGGEQNRILFERLSQVIDLLEGREDLFGAQEVSMALCSFLDQLESDARELYLAKGVLSGSKNFDGAILQGTCFNYDFSDEEGGARILRTGETIDKKHCAPLIETGDLLVTSGLDGVFPADLPVAVVSKILPLHEGGTSYSLEAKPLAQDLNALSHVFVLPPY